MEKEILAYEGDLPFIFLSYSHRDILQAESIIQGLQQLGYRVWFDRGLHGGDQYSDVIAGQIDACHCFLPLLSRHFPQSDYCMDEIHYALEIGKDILPVYLEDMKLSGGLRMRLSRFHALWCTSPGFWREIERSDILDSCREKPQPIPTAAEQPASRSESKPVPKVEKKSESKPTHKPKAAQPPKATKNTSSKAKVGPALSKTPPQPRKNMLKADRNSSDHVFGQNLLRKDVYSITFLDSTANAPKNCWDVSEAGNSSVLAWTTPKEWLSEHYYDLYIAGNGGVLAPRTCQGLFAGYHSLRQINFSGNFDTSMVTDMAAMFSDCTKLFSLELGDMFDTSSVTDMSWMFKNCTNLYLLNLSSHFSTPKVTSMSSMFEGCSSLTALDMGNHFDTSNVATMSAMFSNCRSLRSLHLGGKFDTSNVMDMTVMFAGCPKLKELNMSGWDLSSVTEYDGFMNEGQLLNGRPWEELFQNR